MKTLIKKNLYYENAFEAMDEVKVGSKFMGGTGVWAGGMAAGGPSGGPAMDNIDYCQIGTPGNAIDWGGELLTGVGFNIGVGGDGHRGLLSVGGNPGPITDMNWINFASKGDAVDFGETEATNENAQGTSDGNRGVWYEGTAAPGVDIFYVSLQTASNAIDFGGNRTVGDYGAGCCGDANRAVWMSDFSNMDVIDYITIGNQGSNATDFGEANLDEHYKSGGSNGYRGVFMAGGADNGMEYVTIQTAGIGIDFGNLTAQCVQPSVFSDGSRQICANGFGTQSPMGMDFINIGTLGNAADHGQCTRAAYTTGGMSGN